MENRFEIMEKEVMNKLLDGDDQNLVILRDQYSKAIIKKREFSGVGFFTSFEVPINTPKLKINKSLQIGDVVAQIIGAKDGAGFVLFINEGVIDFLEGYVYGEEQWPNQIQIYKVTYISGVKRDMEKLKIKLQQ